MEISKPQPNSAEDSIDDNFDDFGFKFLCDDVESSKSTSSGTSYSSSLESAPISRYAGNVKPINGFWVIKESPPIRELKEPRLGSQSSQKSGSYSGKSELIGGYRKDTRDVPARPHFRHLMGHSIQSSNIGRKVCETKSGVHEQKESIYIQKPWIGELKVRESPNLEVVYDTNKTCTQGSSRKSDSFESQMVESVVENSGVDAGMSEPGMELVKGEPEATRVNNVHNYSWQFSSRDPRINKELLENDGTTFHRIPMKHSPRDPRIRMLHDLKVTVPPCKIELHDIKKYSPRDPRIKRFHVTETPNMGQSSEDAHVSVSCGLPEQRNLAHSTQRTTYNVEWEEGQGQGDNCETLESQKTDKENDDTFNLDGCHDQNQSLSLTKLKICRVAHSKNMYVSSFCQETSPPRSVEKVDGGLEAENGEPSRSVEKVYGGFEAENGARMVIERPKHDLSSENDTSKFNEKAERLAKLGEKYCQAKVVVRKLQDFDIHKLNNATVDTGSQGHFQSTVGPQVSQSLSQEKIVAITKLHKKRKRRGPRLRKELVLFSKAIPAKNIEDEEDSYQYVFLPSDYIVPAVKPNKSDLSGDESIQSCQPKKDIILDITTSSIDSCVIEKLHHDQKPRELLVDGEFAGAGDSVQACPGNINATSPDLDTQSCIKDPHIDGNFSIEEENHRRYNDTLSTESDLLPSAQCINDSDEKDYEMASINISEDVDINNLEQKSETNVKLLSQVEMETGNQIPLTKSLTGKDMSIIDESNLICRTQKVEEMEIDTGEGLERETQHASWQENGNMSKEVKTTEIEKPSCENNESEMVSSSLKDVDQSHRDDTHERIVEEIQNAFQVNEKQVESDIEKLKEQSHLPTPALSKIEYPLLQDSSSQKSNKRHHLEIANADDHIKGNGGGKLVDINSLEIISPDQVSVAEHLPYKKLRIDGDTVLQEEERREVAPISESASAGYLTMDKKMGFYHKKYNRTKLKLPIGTKYLKNQWMDGGKCTSKPVSSRANLNARKEHSVSEMTPAKEITIKGKPHSPEDSTSPVLDPVVAIEKLRYKLFAEAGVDLSKPSSSLYSGKFQRKLKKKSENEFEHENKTSLTAISHVLKYENASRLNSEKLSDPGSQTFCVREKLGISRNVYEKGHADAMKTASEVQSFGNAHSPKAVQTDHKAFHYQRKYNIGDPRKAEVQTEKRKLSEKNIKQSKRAKIGLLAQKLTLRSVSKTTRVGYSKDGFVEKTIVRKQKPDEVKCQISSSYVDETAELPIAHNVETKKVMSRNEINRNNFVQVKKGRVKSVPENYSKEKASINIKDGLLQKGTQPFEEGSSKSNCVQRELESNDSSLEFNNHYKINELEEAEKKRMPEELKEPNCIKTKESDNMGQAENTTQVNIKTGNVDAGTKECDEKEQCKGDLEERDKKSSEKRKNIPDPRKHSKPKQRPAKCVVCGHVFKTKELLKKHHPCRIKQTRTWSQKALRSRPNRVRKEPLPVLENKSKTSKKPRLLEGSMVHKKSKFKVVKGKTRRKVLQTIRELIEKRKPSHLPHMHILFEQLPENEQFLFQLGLLRKERTVVDDKTHFSPPILAVIVKTDAVAVEDLKTSQISFHEAKLEKGYSICEDEKSFPPILEKMSSNFSEELSPSLTGTTTVGIPECLDPPILEPILVPETFSASQDSLVALNRNMTSDSPSAKQLTERHFTDFIEEMPETVKEKIDILKEKGTSECKLSAASFSKMKSMIKAVKSPNHSMSKSIRRHFTDAISDTEVSTSMSNTVSPLNMDVGEENLYLREIPSGEITFAHIRNMLTLERERKFSKHSLMKLNKDLAVLLTSVKSKSRSAANESSDVKHNDDSEKTSTVTTARNLRVSSASVEEHSSLKKIHSSLETAFKETSLSLEEGSSEINDLRDPAISAHSGEMGKLKLANPEIQSRSSITDNIMGMLSSLEDKGNFAENMKNVLQLLAANLGIQFSEIMQGGNLNKEQEERQQDQQHVVVTDEGYRSEMDEYYSDLETVGHATATANDSEPSLEALNSVSVGSEKGNQPKNDFDQEVPEDSSFVSYKKFNKVGDDDIDRSLLSNANDNEEDSLKEQVFDLLKNMVNRVEDEEIKSIKFVDEVSRAIVTFEVVAENHNNLHLSHPVLSDMEQKDDTMILASEEQIQNDSEGGKEGIGVFESFHEHLDDSKLVIKGRNDDDVVSFTNVNYMESDNPGDVVKERLSVNDRTENSKEDKCPPDRELELVPSTVVSSRFHSEESEVRCEYNMETSKTQDKVCILETEIRTEDVLVHQNTYLDTEYSFQVMDGSEYFLEKSDSQSKKPVHHDSVKERWCPYTGYAIESDDTNEDLIPESENKWQYMASLSKKEHTDGHCNEACRRANNDENKFVIPDISGIHSKTVSNNEASRDDNEIFQANRNARDNFIKSKSFNNDSGIEPVSKVDSELKETKISVVSSMSEPTLNLVKYDSMDRIQNDESRNVMSESGFCSRSEETGYRNDKTLVENHSSFASEKLKKSGEEEYLEKEVVLSGIIKQDIPMVKNLSVYKSDELTANAEDTSKPLYFDRQNDTRDEWYQKDQDVTNLIKYKILHDQQMNHSSSTDKRPIETDVAGDDQNSSLLEKNYTHDTSICSFVEYQSMKTSDGDKKEDYVTMPGITTVTAVGTLESEAGHEFVYHVVEERNMLHIPVEIGLDEVEKEDQTMVKGIVSVDEQVNASVIGSICDYSENHNEDDSKSASSLETISNQTVNASKIGKPDAALHISKFQLELGERSSPVAFINVIAGEQPISRGEPAMEYGNITMKADYVEGELKLSSEESHHHQKVLDEYVTKDSLITDDSQSVSTIEQSQSTVFETSSKFKSSIATASDVTTTEVASYYNKETLRDNVDQNADIDKESIEYSAKAEIVINEVSCYERKREFNETVSEGSDIIESEVNGGRKAPAWSKDVDEMETKSLDSFTFDRFVTNRYEPEAESFHAKCNRLEEFKKNEHEYREDSSNVSAAVKEVSGNDQDLISSCDQQSFQVAVTSIKVLPSFVNIDSKIEDTEKNQPKVANESHSSSLTNQTETGVERDTVQQKLYTRGKDLVPSTRHCEKDEIVTFYVESNKMCSLYSGDISVQSPVVKEPEQHDDNGGLELNNKEIETSKEKLAENEAGSEKHKSCINFFQESVVGEDSLGQSSEAPNNDLNFAVPNIDSHGENVHADLILPWGMEQDDKDTDIVVDSYFISCKDIPSSSHKPIICDSVKSDLSEEVNDLSDIVTDSNYIAEEYHHTAGVVKSNSAGTEIGSGGTYEHKYQIDTTLSDSLKNEKELGLTDFFKIPNQEIIKERDFIDPEVGNIKYKLNISDGVEDERENNTNQEPKDMYDIVVNADPVEEIHSTSLILCQTGLITKYDETLLLEKDCDVQSNEEFHKKPIIPKLLLSSDLPHPVSFSSSEINVGHTTRDPSTTLDDIASSVDEIKKSSTQYNVETLIGSESPVFPEHDCCGTHHYSDHFEESSMFQNVQQQIIDAAQEVDNNVK